MGRFKILNKCLSLSSSRRQQHHQNHSLSCLLLLDVQGCWFSHGKVVGSHVSKHSRKPPGSSLTSWVSLFEHEQYGVRASELWSATGKGKNKQLPSFGAVMVVAYVEPQAFCVRDLNERDPEISMKEILDPTD